MLTSQDLCASLLMANARVSTLQGSGTGKVGSSLSWAFFSPWIPLCEGQRGCFHPPPPG